MNRKRRFALVKPQIHLFDRTGLSQDVVRGLNLIVLAVTLSMVFANITTGAIWTSYQRMLGATPLTLGIISAIPVAASTLQIFASYVLEKTRARRKLFLIFGLINRMAWIGIAVIPFIMPVESGDLRLYAMMAFLALSAGGGSFLNVTFYSLISDLVPLRIRGRYFSSRQAVSLLAGILTGLIVSWIMDTIDGQVAYGIVMILAALFGTADICCYFWMKWPDMRKPEGKGDSFGTMLKNVLSDRGFMKIVGYFTLWSFSVNISAPFINVYFIEHAQMTFTEITVLNQIIPNVATVLVIGWWGRQMDRYGNQPIVQTAGLYCMLLPITYIFTGPRSFMILPVAHALSGMAWPASDLGTQNMYLERAPERNRSMYVAVYFACTQLLGVALSNFVGGLLVSGPLAAFEALNLNLLGFRLIKYNTLFGISGILRMICVLLLLPHLRSGADTPAPKMVRELTGHFSARAQGTIHRIRAKRLRKQYRMKQAKHEEDNAE